MSAEPTVTNEDLLSELGGVEEVMLDKRRLFEPSVKAMYDKEKRVPVFIPTPEYWTHPMAYSQWVQVNGISYVIRADTVVMVPESVKAILDNKRLQQGEVRRQQREGQERMSLPLHLIPTYTR